MNIRTATAHVRRMGTWVFDRLTDGFSVVQDSATIESEASVKVRMLWERNSPEALLGHGINPAHRDRYAEAARVYVRERHERNRKTYRAVMSGRF